MERDGNLLGATALLLADRLLDDASHTAGRGGASGAALAILAQDPGMGIEQLRIPLGLSQSATVRLVDSLVADAMASRAPGRDGRSISIELTRTGRARARSVLARRGQVLDDALAVLSPTERAALTGMLERILAHLTADEAHAERICRLCDLAACPNAECPVEQAGSRR